MKYLPVQKCKVCLRSIRMFIKMIRNAGSKNLASQIYNCLSHYLQGLTRVSEHPRCRISSILIQVFARLAVYAENKLGIFRRATRATRELTYLTLGKGKSYDDILLPRRVTICRFDWCAYDYDRLPAQTCLLQKLLSIITGTRL